MQKGWVLHPGQEDGDTQTHTHTHPSSSQEENRSPAGVRSNLCASMGAQDKARAEARPPVPPTPQTITETCRGHSEITRVSPWPRRRWLPPLRS